MLLLPLWALQSTLCCRGWAKHTLAATAAAALGVLAVSLVPAVVPCSVTTATQLQLEFGASFN
jgi:hypothetical protein